MRCDFKNCTKEATWKVTCIMGMTPRYVELNLCYLHNETPMAIVGMEKVIVK